jgi:antitoxin component of MazEF toxin-antitoxin module
LGYNETWKVAALGRPVSDWIFACDALGRGYSNYVKTLQLKLTRIGNSRGIRLPAEVIERYKLDKDILLELRPEELALRAKSRKKLTWEETYKQMAAAREDWSDFDGAIDDGIE